MGSRAIDLAGQIFGRLTVIERAGSMTGCGEATWLARCNCGEAIIAKGTSLRSGRRTECVHCRRKRYGGVGGLIATGQRQRSRRRRTDRLPDDAAIIRDYAAGLPWLTIADRHRVSAATVGNILRRAGVPKRRTT